MNLYQLSALLSGGLMLASGFVPGAVQRREVTTDEYNKQFVKDKFTFADLMKGDRLPTAFKPSELPDGYKAFRIQASGESGFSEFFNGPMGMLMFMPMGGGGGNTREATAMKLVDVLDLTWTRGDLIQIVTTKEDETFGAVRPGMVVDSNPTWDPYLVTYKAELSVSDMMSISENPSQTSDVSLKLHLIKYKSITAITPEPQFTKEKLAESLGATLAEMGKQPSARDRARRAAGLSNAKQLALGLLMYCSDSDDVLPFVESTAEVKKAIAPYTKNDALWDTLNPKSQFRFNMCLSGVSSTAVESPAETPMIYESAPGVDGTRIVAFVDGHAKLVLETEWPGMGKFLKLKLPRTTKRAPAPVHPGPVQGPKPPPGPMPGPPRMPRNDPPPTGPDQSRALSNAKQLATAMAIYCADYDDELPYVQSVATVKEVIRPYTRNDDLWNTGNPASQWRFNMCVGGVSTPSIPDIESVPMIYESAPWPDSRRAVVFCDGSARLVGAAEWQDIAKYLKLKLPRMAKKPLPAPRQGAKTKPATAPGGPPPDGASPPGR